MSTSRHFDKICCIVLALTLLITVLFMNGEALGIAPASRVMGYESRLFDYTEVHTIDLVVDDWEGFLETCTDEEYIECAAVIDGEAYKNIAIRAKGNTSLSSVKSYGNDRYSFKLEFDHFDSTNTYHGLDKLCLNNIIQDNTYMKDFLVYQMMLEYGAKAPLCSFAYITVNGEDWGLYLAVEAVEDSFLQRNYGSDYGELYKPDSMNMGGGRGNGKDFDMGEFTDDEGRFDPTAAQDSSDNSDAEWQARGDRQHNGERGSVGGFGSFAESFDISVITENLDKDSELYAIVQSLPENATMQDLIEALPENFDMREIMSSFNEGFDPMDMAGDFGGKGGFGGGFAMGGSDAKLQYIDDDPDSYSTIFDSAKTDINDTDKQRMIEALKALGEQDTSSVFIEDVIRYFVVHNFVCNGDSYTGNMIHNYYLYEDDGQLAMLPWDYNLAFGGFDGNNATSTINTPIDTPVSGGTGEDRPMAYWIFSSEQYLEMYHEYFDEFMVRCFDSGFVTELIDNTAALIAPYVEKDPTKFCTYEEFTKGVSTLREFCVLRAESVNGQLNGSIPSTTEGLNSSDALIDASHISISDMGSMGFGGGMGGGNFGDRSSRGERGVTGSNPQPQAAGSEQAANTAPEQDVQDSVTIAAPENSEASSLPAQDMLPPENSFGDMPDGFVPPDGMMPPQGGSAGERPENGMTPPDGAMTPPDGTGINVPDNSASDAATAERGSNSTPAENTVPDDTKTPTFPDTIPEGFSPPDGTAAPDRTNVPDGFMPQDTQQAADSDPLIWLGGSVLMLSIGLIIAKLYKR